MSPGNRRFPRLLVVTDYPPDPLSGSALIRQMLRGFPREQVHWWCSASHLPSAAASGVGELHHCPVPPRFRPYVRMVRLKSEILGAWWVPRAARHLRSTVAQIRPDQIWVQLTGWAIPAFVKSGLVHGHRCHVSIWDYQNNAIQSKASGARWARRLSQQSEELYRLATSCDAVSEPMREDLAARTGRGDAIVIHSGFEPGQIERLIHQIPETSDEVGIAYAGSILVPGVFRDFLRALKQVRSELTRPVRLHLFSRSFRSEPWFEPEWMCDHGLVPDNEFIEELRRCSWGLALMNIREDDDPAYHRYSFPNKLGTYLSAGLPLVLLAHRDSTAARMFRQYPAGIHSDTTAPEVLQGLLRKALDEANPKQRYREAILHCAAGEFDAARMRRRLWQCFGVEPV